MRYKKSSNKTVITSYLFALFLPTILIASVLVMDQDLSVTEANPTIINGLLTVSAIIFGFSAFPLEKRMYKILMPFFHVQIWGFVFVGLSYFTEFLMLRYATILTLGAATVNLLIVLLSWYFVQELYSQQIIAEKKE